MAVRKVTKKKVVKKKAAPKKTVAMKSGGKSKSRVNEAGNYTKPTMRKNLFNRIKAGRLAKRNCWHLSTKRRVADTSNGGQKKRPAERNR